MRSIEQVVIISGAASGIGLELGRLFARRGASVGLIDRDRTKLEEFADELLRAGARCTISIIDVRQREQVQGAVQEIVRALGPPDILIPCAGVCRASTVDDLKIADLEEIVRINFLGVIYMIEAALPAMLPRKSGHIVGISSMAGLRGSRSNRPIRRARRRSRPIWKAFDRSSGQGVSPSRRCSRAMYKPRYSMRSMA
jgi:NADP-dependent 3-hydroxy acid dehydrogenase YdfG